jgi:hypothetical protein
MSVFRPSRRRVLRGLLKGSAVAVSLPLFDYLLNDAGTAYAAGGGLPKRFGLFFWGNGNVPAYWTPIDEGANYTLSEQLMPLAPVQDLVTVVTGMAVKIQNHIPHASGSAGILSAAPLTDDESFSQPSIDQVIANEVGSDTLYASLQTAAYPQTGLSYAGVNSIYPPEADPLTLYERLFGSTFREPGEEGIVDPTLALRQSVLDAVMGDIDKLNQRLGVNDRARLDQHLTGVRELELRLVKAQEDPPNLASCARPTQPPSDFPDIDGRPQLSARSRAMCDMLAMAFACDQSRVFAHYFSHPVNDILFPNATAGHHDLTHNEGGEQPEVRAITTQCVEEYAYLVQALANVEEGGETLLDHCIVLGTSEVSLGRTHSVEEMPILIGGSGCGVLKQGIHHRSYSKENVTKVLLSVMRGMDMLIPEYGVEDAYATDSLSEIEV